VWSSPSLRVLEQGASSVCEGPSVWEDHHQGEARLCSKVCHEQRDVGVPPVNNPSDVKRCFIFFQSIWWFEQILIFVVIVAVAPYFLLLLVFSHRRLLPQHYTYGCHMEAMLKPCDCLAAPTVPVLQARSPGIWLPDLFERLFTRITFPIRVM
jgi:hypothetical protein